MFALFDEAGKLLTGRVMSEAENSLQIELDSGKRIKVKSANVLLKFDKPSPGVLMPQAESLSHDIELDLAWEFAPENEFGFAELAAVYFQDPPLIDQQVATLLRLSEAPHYFRRAGKGRYKKAGAEVLQQALAAIEKKKQLQAQIEQWTADLAAGQCPPAIREQLYKILFKPDKNAPEYKAVAHAAKSTHLPPLTLLQQAGAIGNAYQFHWQRFLFEHFPKGTGFPALQGKTIADNLPLATVSAFSIDDSSTTEIDDALSVQGLGSGTVTVGIHIAAPGLAINPEDSLDKVARQRLSTVYMPGHKVTMLPDNVVQTYTLLAGGNRPALSLYLTLDEAELNIQSSCTRLELVPITHNLRHDQLDQAITATWLEDAQAPAGADLATEIAALRPELSFLYRLAKVSKARREVVRGKPETFNRPDYTFKLADSTADEPEGHETVLIGVRTRGAPLDLLVAEAMILANSTWGLWLAECGVPGIYRSQASLAPGIKVRMGARALPHAGIGVAAYAWSTSPLRRYTDLVNQWQLIACVRHGKTAALAAPFRPKDAQLFAIISAFDAAYTAYNQFQNGMERYWTLRYLQQHQLTELTATVIKEGLVRADELPLVLNVLGAESLARGAPVRIRLGRIDEISLEVGGTVIERLQATNTTDSSTENEEEIELATPIAITMDLGEEEAGGAETPSATATV